MYNEPTLEQQIIAGGECERNPVTCPCRGRGYYLCDLDVWVCCRFHCGSAPLPPEDGDNEPDFDFAAHYLGNLRAAFSLYRADTQALRPAINNERFTEQCRVVIRQTVAAYNDGRNVPYKIHTMSPEGWVLAAEALYNTVASQEEEKEALRRGFACGLEMRLAQEAVRERLEAGLAPSPRLMLQIVA